MAALGIYNDHVSHYSLLKMNSHFSSSIMFVSKSSRYYNNGNRETCIRT